MTTNDTREVKTAVGTFVMKKPKAGVRNRAIIKAETHSGQVKTTVLMTELVPACVLKRPADVDQDVPIGQVLDELEMDDYDNLFEALSEMMGEDSNGLSEEKK